MLYVATAKGERWDENIQAIRIGERGERMCDLQKLKGVFKSHQSVNFLSTKAVILKTPKCSCEHWGGGGDAL